MERKFVLAKFANNRGRKSLPYECMLLNKLMTKYGVDIVYDVMSLVPAEYNWYKEYENKILEILVMKEDKKYENMSLGDIINVIRKKECN